MHMVCGMFLIGYNTMRLTYWSTVERDVIADTPADITRSRVYTCTLHATMTYTASPVVIIHTEDNID